MGFKTQDEKKIPKIKLINPNLEACVYTLKFVNNSEFPRGAGNRIQTLLQHSLRFEWAPLF